MSLRLDLKQAAEEFEESILLHNNNNKLASYKSVLLLPIADYSSPISLRKLRRIRVPAPLRRLKLVPGALLDEKELNWVFATGEWRDSQESPQTLIATMPPGTVSGRIRRVGVWKRLERALERPPSKVAAYGDRAFFIIDGTSSAAPYLVTIDLKRRLIASSCPEYNSTNPNSRRRFEICKHVAAALTYYRHEIFDLSNLPKNVIEEWEASYQRSYSYDMLANYHYYFIKKFVPLLGFRASYYADENAVREAVRCVVNL
jgi:hypothetical protein